MGRLVNMDRAAAANVINVKERLLHKQAHVGILERVEGFVALPTHYDEPSQS
jgi:hypothetical protein